MEIVGINASINNWNLNLSTQDLYIVRKILSSGERWLYRHRSGMGTVLEFDDGIDYRKVLILDAKYRTTGIDMGVAELLSLIHI